MARLYADENFPRPVVAELCELGHDVLTIQEAGAAEQSTPDEAVLAFAVATGPAVLTLNRKHFARLHETRPDHAGIIVCTFDPNFAGRAERIHTAIAALTQLAGQLIRVNRPGPS